MFRNLSGYLLKMAISLSWILRSRRVSIASGGQRSFIWVSGRNFAVAILCAAGLSGWLVFSSSVTIIELLKLSDADGPSLQNGADQIEDTQAGFVAAADAVATVEAQLESALAELQERDADMARLRAQIAEISTESHSVREDEESFAYVEPSAGIDSRYLLVALEKALADLQQERERTTGLQDENSQLAHELSLMEERTERVILRILESVELANQGLKRVFRAVDVNPERLADDIKETYLGRGGPDDTILPSGSPIVGVGSIETGLVLLDTALQDLHALRIAYLGMPFGDPVAGSVRRSSNFGWRIHPVTKRHQHHNGIDLAGPTGTPILAAGNGRVIFAGRDGGYGKIVTLRHVGGAVSKYAHLRSFDVSVGENVSRGQIIGYMGSTGLSTGPHLHFEVLLQGDAVDPGKFMRIE